MLNTNDSYGLVSILLHWVMVVMVAGLLGIGWYMVDLTYYDSLYEIFHFSHKSVGVLFGFLLIIRLIWKLSNVTPTYDAGVSSLEGLFANIIHIALYVLMVLIVISGYLISTADNSAVSVFDFFYIPATITSIPDQEDVAGLVHEYLGYCIIALIVFHISGALKHHFINKDNTLRRMLGMN